MKVSQTLATLAFISMAGWTSAGPGAFSEKGGGAGDCRLPTNAVVVQDVRGYNSWPMIQAAGDRLVCSYSRDNALPKDGHNISAGSRDSYAKVSLDGGRTWSKEITVAADPQIGEVNEGIGLDSTGAWLAWVRCWGKKEHRRHELYRSRDGFTFEKICTLRPDPFPMQVMDPVVVPGLGLVSPWFAGQYRRDGQNSWGLLISRDDGKTWEQRTIEDGLSVKDWVTEPSLVALGGDRLLIIGRCEQGLGSQFQVTSVDGGKTWRKSRTNITDVKESTPSLIYDPATDLLANYYYHRGARKLKRRVARAAHVFDHPDEWPEPETLAEGFEPRAYDAGNVKATRLGGTIDCCAWYTGTTSNAAVVVTRVKAPVGRGAEKPAVSDVRFTKPTIRWLWGGLGFHNSEATMLPMMTEEFRDERVYKTFREIAPTYSRVFAGFADWTKAAMDSFADYYDNTFRQAGTTLYMVPGRFPYIHKEFDAKTHFDAVARNCAYLVNERKLTKLRYYNIANELSVGNEYAWFWRNAESKLAPDLARMALYKSYNELMYLAFRREGLDIGLMTSDGSGASGVENNLWATKNLDEFTDTYCWHVYEYGRQPGDPGIYAYVYTNCQALVRAAGRREKRLSLGEFGYQGRPPLETHGYGSGVMRDDGTFSFRYPDQQHLGALVQVEMAMAAMNAGCVSAVRWTLFDYPHPFLREDGDTPEEKARYDVVRFSGHGLTCRYNKCGMVAWNDDEHDYSARADLYALGYAAKFFRKGGRILPSESADATLRSVGITQADGSATYLVLNWGEAKSVRVTTAHPATKPLRVYRYDSAHVPYNAFNDLQKPEGTVRQSAAGEIVFDMPAKSLVFLTTDYVERVPPSVEELEFAGGVLSWRASADRHHVYYRVYRRGRQIASTVATHFARGLPKTAAADEFRVTSVDRWGNESTPPIPCSRSNEMWARHSSSAESR